MTGGAARIVLASASPRRRALLAAAGLAFEVQPAQVDERLEDFLEPEEAARRLAQRKATAAAARVACAAHVIGADTIVALRTRAGAWRLLGKPSSGAEAADMLRALSCTRHVVVTGIAVVSVPAGTVLLDAEHTAVTMRAITDAEIDAYVASGEWRDKAGGYAIQENADRFVTALEGGGFDNVVGLPVARTLRLLAAAGAPSAAACLAALRPPR